MADQEAYHGSDKPLLLTKLIVKFPKTVMAVIGTVAISITLIVWLMNLLVFAEDMGFEVRGDQRSLDILAVSAAKELADEAMATAALPRQSQILGFMLLMYVNEVDDSTNGIFNEAALEDMKAAEAIILEDPRYEEFCLRVPVYDGVWPGAPPPGPNCTACNCTEIPANWGTNCSVCCLNCSALTCNCSADEANWGTNCSAGHCCDTPWSPPPMPDQNLMDWECTDYGMPPNTFLPQYRTPGVLSPLSLFMDMNTKTIFPEAQIGALLQGIAMGIQAKDRAAMGAAFFMDKGFSVTNLKSDITRSTIIFGGPLEGYQHVDLDTVAQTDILDEWAVELVPELDAATTDNIEVLYFGTSLIYEMILGIMYHDLLLAFGSLAFVFAYLWFHSASIMMATAGMFHIAFSFPLAFAAFTWVLGVKSIYPLASLSVYIILAIGADDIFVYMDAYRQSFYDERSSSWTDLERTSFVWRRAAKAMAITSATSCGAFLATALSSLRVVASFGVFSSLLVVFNYLLVITWFPCAVLILHRRRYGSKKTSPAPMEDGIELDVGSGLDGKKTIVGLTGAVGFVEEDAENVGPRPQKPRALELFFNGIWFKFLLKAKYVIIVFFVIMGGLAAWRATYLVPADRQEQFLPDWHPFQRLIDMMVNDYQDSSEDLMVEVDLVFGIKDYEMGDFFDGSDMGTVTFDDDFDLTNPASQEWLFDLCQRLKTNENVYQGENDVTCIMEDYARFLNESVGPGLFPTSSAMFPQLFFGGFLADPTNAYTYQGFYGRHIDGTTSFISIRASTTLKNMGGNVPLDKSLPVYDAWQKFVEDEAEVMPDSLGTKIIQTADLWGFVASQEAFISGALNGAAASMGLAWVILTLATQNIIVSTYAVITITGAVACILGITVFALDWQLGVIESISATILVGLSVDYSVHLCERYMECPAPDRVVRGG